MSFKFVKTDTFKHRVDVVVPSDDPNKPHTGHYFATSRRHPKDNLKDITSDDDEFIRQTLVHVDGFEVDGGSTDQDVLRETIIGESALSASYLKSYFEASNGVAQKNSLRSSRR